MLIIMSFMYSVGNSNKQGDSIVHKNMLFDSVVNNTNRVLLLYIGKTNKELGLHKDTITTVYLSQNKNKIITVTLNDNQELTYTNRAEFFKDWDFLKGVGVKYDLS